MPSPFREDLIARYDRPGPRYTSYPPATEFHDQVDDRQYREWIRQSNEEPIPRPLSLYVHIPFCQSICYYCACNKIITKRREKAEPYLEDLYREIALQAGLFDADREVTQLHWGGGTPGFLTQIQSTGLMEQLRRYFRLSRDPDRDYSIELDPRVVGQGEISHLRQLGFNRVSLGVQDLDPQVQQAINRIQSLELTANVIDSARRQGFRSVNIDLIYGLPLQTRDSFAETLRHIIDLAPDRIAIYNYAHLPHRFPPQRRINAEDLPSAETRLSILHLAVDELTGAGYEYIGMDHFARPGDDLAVAQRHHGLQRNFQGYSTQTQCDLVGLGVSSISQVHDNYAQNTTSLEQYHESLENSRLPLIRGYQSTREDLLRRDVIQQLTCHFHVDKRALAQKWDIAFDQHFADELSQLEDMAEDELVELGEDSITVTATGRFLVRNICMVFDSYQGNGGDQPRFSRTL